jgi:tripartite-type tricarboxylate transporter receptor subunit TctC
MELAAKAAADGYTLILAPAGNLTVNPSLYRSVPYDVARDFAPVTVIAAVPNVLVVNPAVPAQSLAELIRYAKANPGRLNFSSPGSGSGAHLAAELLKTPRASTSFISPITALRPR